ncbi:MAG: pitrilysin family protein [Candidatus Babeliales bacterium]
MAGGAFKEKKVYKTVLDNGLTVLVRPNAMIPKVSTQLWYGVGSKDEISGEKGIAHLIEHMIFKGTKRLSESDINMITHKLSGYCNAFTSYDYTGYLFDFPAQHWVHALDLMADCMQNCTFKQPLLNSEMKAVIQELKMYRDDYSSTLIEQLFSAVFSDHPYHYPIIGFKQDLWSVNSQNLHAFYKKHYVPNNATLVVVGAVEPDTVFTQAAHYFGAISAAPHYTKATHPLGIDIAQKSVTIFRDVQQEKFLVGWVIPGTHAKKDYFCDMLTWILGQGKSSILYHLIVDELQLANDLEAFCYDMFDSSIFFIYCEPKEHVEAQQIIDLINREIERLKKEGISPEQLSRASKQTQATYLNLLESNQKQAYVIGQSYLATLDEQYLFNYLNNSEHQTRTEIQQLLHHYFRSSLMHSGYIKPLDEHDKDYWQLVQQRSDQDDARVLSAVKREEAVEPGVYVDTVSVQQPEPFTFARAQKNILKNNITLLSYHNSNVDKIELLISLPTKGYYDPEPLQGLGLLLANTIIEGTKNYTGTQLADAIESRGMGLRIIPGHISMSMLSADLKEGLSFVRELVINATLEPEAIEKVRGQMMADLKEYWDEPTSFVSDFASDAIYKGHPYSKSMLGTPESIARITAADVQQAYQKYMSLNGARMAIVGDIQKYDVLRLVEEQLGDLAMEPVQPMIFPPLQPISTHDVTHRINRDQVVLGFAQPSIARTNPDFDALLIFDQIFAGGVLGSMSSRLFELRERSGLFYTVSGSLLYHADEQPGMVFIKTLVSMDRVQEAQLALMNALAHAADRLEEYELQQAKQALINSMVDNFSSNQKMGSTFLYLDRFGLPEDYFDTRASVINAITRDQVLAAVRRLINMNSLVKIRIGRV